MGPGGERGSGFGLGVHNVVIQVNFNAIILFDDVVGTMRSRGRAEGLFGNLKGVWSL